MTEYWPGIKDGLKEWIKSIKYTCADEHLKPLINSCSDYLSFNYTNTLEILYGIDRRKILYLHGNALRDDELILGHREKSWYPEWDPQDLPV